MLLPHSHSKQRINYTPPPANKKERFFLQRWTGAVSYSFLCAQFNVAQRLMTMIRKNSQGAGSKNQWQWLEKAHSSLWAKKIFEKRVIKHGCARVHKGSSKF
jgi:hypothetical protein